MHQKKQYGLITKKIMAKNQAPEEIFLNSPEDIFITTYAIKPSAIPLAIENVKGIIIIIIKNYIIKMHSIVGIKCL